jgi:hypothetical protein
LTAARALVTNGSDWSHAVIEAGAPCSQIDAVSAPVPHPTSSQWDPGGAASQSTNCGANRRLQRPM